MPSGWVVSFVGCCLLAILPDASYFYIFDLLINWSFRLQIFVLFFFCRPVQSLCCFCLSVFISQNSCRYFIKNRYGFLEPWSPSLGTIYILYFISERARQGRSTENTGTDLSLDVREHIMQHWKNAAMGWTWKDPAIYLNNQINAIMQLISEKDYSKAETAADELKERCSVPPPVKRVLYRIRLTIP